jgi:hypothetical protein
VEDKNGLSCFKASYETNPHIFGLVMLRHIHTHAFPCSMWHKNTAATPQHTKKQHQNTKSNRPQRPSCGAAKNATPT